MTPSACFSQSYAEARGKFLAACTAAGLDVESHIHPLPGRDGELLALDVARAGPAHSHHLLIVSSGCHGVEGFCGSAVQIALLRDAQWLADALAGDCAVLFLHAANPYGFSWWRRWTHENVDLNRNFLDFSTPPPQNPGYQALDPLLIPPHWPARMSHARLLLHALRHGRQSLQAAISAGQASHPRGLFYVGSEPTWSNRAVRAVLRRHGQQCRELAWIDLHTGLGPRGHGEYIHSGEPTAESLNRARAWWGEALRSSEEGNSVSVRLSGKMAHAALEECPQARLTPMTLEFGTLPGLQVLDALRAEQWLECTAQVPADKAARIKRQLRDAFYVDADDWKQQVLEQSRVAVDQALSGLRATA